MSASQVTCYILGTKEGFPSALLNGLLSTIQNSLEARVHTTSLPKDRDKRGRYKSHKATYAFLLSFVENNSG